jgi:hypothetical protein
MSRRIVNCAWQQVDQLIASDTGHADERYTHLLARQQRTAIANQFLELSHTFRTSLIQLCPRTAFRNRAPSYPAIATSCRRRTRDGTIVRDDRIGRPAQDAQWQLQATIARKRDGKQRQPKKIEIRFNR